MHATVALLENGVIQRLVYTSDLNASKTGTAKFSEMVNNKYFSKNMGRLKEHTHSFLDHYLFTQLKSKHKKNEKNPFDFLVLVL